MPYTQRRNPITISIPGTLRMRLEAEYEENSDAKNFSVFMEKVIRCGMKAMKISMKTSEN